MRHFKNIIIGFGKAGKTLGEPDKSWRRSAFD